MTIRSNLETAAQAVADDIAKGNPQGVEPRGDRPRRPTPAAARVLLPPTRAPPQPRELTAGEFPLSIFWPSRNSPAP